MNITLETKVRKTCFVCRSKNNKNRLLALLRKRVVYTETAKDINEIKILASEFNKLIINKKLLRDVVTIYSYKE